MTIPDPGTAVPPRVAELAHGASLTPVWSNHGGGLTFRTDDDRFIKWGPRSAETSMAAERTRLAWAKTYILVPHVLESGADDVEEWLVTAALPGQSAVTPRWVAEPATAVQSVGRGLRMLHDALPAAECPFDWSVPARVENAEGRGIRVPARFRDAPPIDRLVVCHGDACCPNTLLSDDGEPLAHVDLGALGLADRWADIAVASRNTVWNYGPGWEDLLIAAYGVEPDRERLDFYSDLWDAT